MIVTKKALPRRTFLRGMGVTLALPLLDAMVPALSAMTQTAATPVGSNIAQWTPSRVGRITELSPTLASLTPFLDRVTVVSNLQLRNAYTVGGAGNHASSNCAFLSAAHAKVTEGTDYELGTTADQVAATGIGKQTPLPSLELAIDSTSLVGNCDNGLACAYMNSLSWSSPSTPLPSETNPRIVFERLFGDGGSTEERRAELRTNGSLLDWVLKDLASLQRQVGAGDRIRLDQYLDSIREVERRIQTAEQHAADQPDLDLERPVGVPASWEDHVNLMFELQVLALQADITRVITFQLSREQSTRTYPQIGVPDPHHPTSHHDNLPEKLVKLAKINAYHVSLFAGYLKRLQATADGQGSLLDNGLYLLGSGMGDPNVHNHTDLPVLVAGAGSGTLQGGRHIHYAEPTPMANLLLTLLDKLGVRLDSFADSTARVKEMFEPLSI
jgi:Protein of unknown function (DUF1552)